MVDRVLEQRLDRERGQARAHRQLRDVPGDLEPVPKPSHLDALVDARELELFLEREQLAGVAERDAEEIREILRNEQEHQIDLATALGEEVPRIDTPRAELREPTGARR